MLSSLSGLEFIEALGQDRDGISLAVSDNEELQSLEALSTLRGNLPGSVTIMNNKNLVSLRGLEGIESVGKERGGDGLRISGNPVLRSLSALSAVQGKLPGALVITSNAQLTSLQGLEGIQGLGANDQGNSLYIAHNRVLRSIEALSAVRGTLPGGLIVFGNAQLASLQGLEGVEGLAANGNGNSLYLRSNDQLASVEALSTLRGNLPGSLVVWENARLASLQGLDGVEGLGANKNGNSLYLVSNIALQSIEGLSAVRGKFPGSVTIMQNPNLTSLIGLEGVEALGINSLGGSLYIKNNVALSSIEALSAVRGDLPGGLVIMHNSELPSLQGLEGVTGLGRTGEGNSLYISHNPALRSLDGLSAVCGRLPGALTVDANPQVSSLRGLECIEALGSNVYGSSLKIADNPSLRSIQELSAVRGALAGAVVIQENAQLASLGGLQNITGLGCDIKGNSLYIEDNAVLESLDALSSVRGLDGSLTIAGNPKLVSLHGLDGIQALQKNAFGESLRISGNPELSSLEALSGVHGQLPGALVAANNHKLESLQGLHNISGLGQTSDGNSLYIEGNRALRSLTGLSQIRGELPGALTIQGNTNLRSLQGLEGIAAVGGNNLGERVKVSHNPVLRSLEAISMLLSTLGTEGLAVQDLHCDAGWYQRQGGLACSYCGQDFISKPASIIPERVEASTTVCKACPFWQEPNDTQDECRVVLWVLLGLVSSFCALMLGCTQLTMQLQLTRSFGSHWEVLGRSIRISDVSLERGTGIVLTSAGHHRLRPRLGRSFPIKLRSTGTPFLDTHRTVQLRARVLSKDRLELLDVSGRTLDLNGKLDTSMGEAALPARWALLHSGYRIPLIVAVPLLISAGLVGFAILAVEAELYTVVGVSAGMAFAASILSTMLCKWRGTSRTPLQCRLDLYHGKLDQQNPKPRACQRGPGRAVRLSQILDLYDFFKVFIQMRDMHYLEPNIIRHLTSRHRLSYAEIAGPSQVEWFVSHCWLHPFAGTCSALEKHAQGVAVHRQWQDLAYWICTLSNNQYDVKRELGFGSWEQSSFYLALQDEGCHGTCMILDEHLHPLRRSWCLFELLTSILKSEEVALQVHTELICSWDIMFCTSSGILNRGEASVEVALNIGKQLSDVRLEDAAASAPSDKDMIDQVVIAKMGSFDKINTKLQDSMAQALEASRSAVLDEFDRVLLACGHTTLN